MITYSFNELLEKGILKDTPVAVAIGVFDGVHLGHKDIFTSLVSYAKENEGVKSMVITFSKNPKKNSPQLDTMRLRKEYAESFCIDFFTVIDFSMNFSKITGSEFIRLLRTMCRIKRVVVGEDFKCGYPENQITADKISEEFALLGERVSVDIRPQVVDVNGRRISSTMLREMISSGRLDQAIKLSSRPYQIDCLGFPLECKGDNLVLNTSDIQQLLPKAGLYQGSAVSRGGKEVKTEFTIGFQQISFKCRDPEEIQKSGLDRICIYNQGEW